MNFSSLPPSLLTVPFLTNDECLTIKNYILDNEELVKSMGDDEYPGTNENSLLGRYYCFNWLNTIIGETILIPKLRTLFKNLDFKFPIIVECWGNTLRKNEGVDSHVHNTLKQNMLETSKNKFLSDENVDSEIIDTVAGHIFISGPLDVGTRYYENSKFENMMGSLSLFHRGVSHSVDKNPYDEVRITLGLDIHQNQDGTILNNYEIEYLDRYYILKENTNGKAS